MALLLLLRSRPLCALGNVGPGFFACGEPNPALQAAMLLQRAADPVPLSVTPHTPLLLLLLFSDGILAYSELGSCALMGRRTLAARPAALAGRDTSSTRTPNFWQCRPSWRGIALQRCWCTGCGKCSPATESLMRRTSRRVRPRELGPPLCFAEDARLLACIDSCTDEIYRCTEQLHTDVGACKCRWNATEYMPLQRCATLTVYLYVSIVGCTLLQLKHTCSNA